MSQQKIATRIVERKLLLKKLVKLAHGTPETMAQEGRAPNGLPNPWVAAGLISPYSTNFRSAQDPLPAMTPQEYADRYMPDRDAPSIGARPADKPFPGVKPAENYRGEGGYWDFGLHPAIAQHQKTFKQLDAEQGTQSKYLPTRSVWPAMSALGQGVLGGGMQHMFYNLAAYPAVATDALGMTTGATQTARENSIISADKFWRGLHQLSNPTTSRAYDQMWGANGAVVENMADLAFADGHGSPASDAYEKYTARQGLVDMVAPLGGSAVTALPATLTAAPAAAGTALSLGPTAASFPADYAQRTSNTTIGMNDQEHNRVVTDLTRMLEDMSPEELETIAANGLYVNIRGQSVPFDRLAPETAQSLAAASGLNALFNTGLLPMPHNMRSNSARIAINGMPQLPPGSTSGFSDVNLPDTFSNQSSPDPATTDELNPPPQESPTGSLPAPSPATESPTIAATPAQPTINEPDLSDPFGDKQPPTPQLPPGVTLPPELNTPENVNAIASAANAIKPTDENRAAISDINSPEAQKKIREGENAYLEPGAADYAKTTPPPTNSPGEWAKWLNGMMDHVNTSWNNMSPEAQLAFGLGVPLAVIGLLSGNVGGFLLGAVGLGTAGIAAAGSGMFGDTAQTAAESVTGSKTPEPIKPLSDDEQLSVVRGLSSATNPMEYVGANKNEFMQIADLSDDRLIAIAQQFDPQTRAGLVKILTKFNEDIDSGMATLDKLPELMRPAAAAIKLPKGVSLEDIPQLKTKVERMLQILNGNQATSANNAGAYIQNDLIPKIARCWKGYEPVPGKKPYSEDSCRPQGSKKKKKMKKKAEDYLSFLSSDKPAILTLIRGYYDKQTGPQSKKVSA